MAKPPEKPTNRKKKSSGNESNKDNNVGKGKEVKNKASTNNSTKDITKVDVSKPESSKTTNAVKKEDVDKVKGNVVHVNPKHASPDELLTLITNHIASIIKRVGEIDDRKFTSVSEIVESSLNELAFNDKLNKQDPKSKKLRQSIEYSRFYLEDQLEAINKANEKY